MLDISVIISTYNGKHKILDTLHALESQAYQGFESIVVIDGSTDGTKEFLNKQSLNLSSLRIIEQNNQGRACVRNNGAKLAQGDVLVFYDDDMTPENDSIIKHREFHQQNRSAICGGSPIERIADAKTDFDKYRCSIRRNWLQKYAEGLNLITQESIFLTAANFSISKKTFLEIGKFNEQLNDAEDLEFAFRSLSKGYDIYFDKSNIAWHRDFVSCEKYIKRRRDYATAYEQLKTIAPELFSDRKRIIELNFFKKIVFSLFSNPIWVKAIHNQYLTFIPKPIRYKIYDLVITGLGSVFPNRSVSFTHD